MSVDAADVLDLTFSFFLPGYIFNTATPSSTTTSFVWSLRFLPRWFHWECSVLLQPVLCSISACTDCAFQVHRFKHLNRIQNMHASPIFRRYDGCFLIFAFVDSKQLFVQNTFSVIFCSPLYQKLARRHDRIHFLAATLQSFRNFHLMQTY